MSTLNTTNLKNPSSGSNNIVLATDGSTTIATLNSTTITGTSVRGVITSGTAVASTSGTAIDFTGIPSWVKRITIMFDGVSTNGTSYIRLQLGDSGGIETTGYTGATSYAGVANTTGSAAFSNGFDSFGDNGATVIRYGSFVLANITSNTWVLNGNYGVTTPSVYTMQFSGIKALSGTLDRIRITTVNGTDAFDAGTINILYEG